MISGKINNTQMVVILLLCKKTHYLFHNNWLIFWGMSLISMVLFRLLILICKMLGKNLTSSYILQEIKNLHLINHPYSQSDNFHLKNWSPLNTFKIKNQRYVPELKKKKKLTKCIFLKKRRAVKIENQTCPFKLTLCPSEMHFLFFTAFRNICWFYKMDTEQCIADYQNHSNYLAINVGSFRASLGEKRKKTKNSYSDFYKLHVFFSICILSS